MAKLLNIKKDFPVLVNNPNLSYLDTGATALKPYAVIDKINEYYTKYGVNVNRGVYSLSYQATLEYEETRNFYDWQCTFGSCLAVDVEGRLSRNQGDVPVRAGPDE